MQSGRTVIVDPFRLRDALGLPGGYSPSRG
jgi:hypothetical protein